VPEADQQGALFLQLLSAIISDDALLMEGALAAMDGADALNTAVSVSLVSNGPGSPPSFVPMTPPVVTSPEDAGDAILLQMQGPHLSLGVSHVEASKAPLSGVASAACVSVRKSGAVINTPLMWAVRFQNESAVQQILTAGADVNVSNESGQTPLHYACMTSSNMAVLRCLLRAGADANLRDNEGTTPLAIACRAGRAGMVRVLQEYGGNPQVQDMCGLNAASLAACFGHMEVLQQLLADQPIAGCDRGDSSIEAARSLLQDADHRGWTPLFWGVAVGKVDCVRLLLGTHLFQLKHVDVNGDSVLHLACKEGDVDIVRLILREANRSRSLQVRRDTLAGLLAKTNHLGQHPLDMCAYYCQPECAGVIRQSMEVRLNSPPPSLPPGPYDIPSYRVWLIAIPALRP